MCCFVLPGTTRLPGSYKENERQAPRLVKTYTERLKEMKRQHRPYHKPPQARQRVDPGQSEAGLPNLPDLRVDYPFLLPHLPVYPFFKNVYDSTRIGFSNLASLSSWCSHNSFHCCLATDWKHICWTCMTSRFAGATWDHLLKH